jgi:hypothetical protein
MKRTIGTSMLLLVVALPGMLLAGENELSSEVLVRAASLKVPHAAVESLVSNEQGSSSSVNSRTVAAVTNSSLTESKGPPAHSDMQVGERSSSLMMSNLSNRPEPNGEVMSPRKAAGCLND